MNLVEMDIRVDIMSNNFPSAYDRSRQVPGLGGAVSVEDLKHLYPLNRLYATSFCC